MHQRCLDKQQDSGKAKASVLCEVERLVVGGVDDGLIVLVPDDACTRCGEHGELMIDAKQGSNPLCAHAPTTPTMASSFSKL